MIASSLELATLRAEGHPTLGEPLQTAAAATSRAAVLTRQLLAYAGRAPSAHVPLDLNDVVRAIGDLLAVSVPRKVTLRRALEPNLPAVRGDPAQLQQVVMNLVTNGADAIGDADGTVTLRTQAIQGPAGKWVQLTVTDTGCGMTPEVQAKAFDPFFSTKGAGRGLGLAALAGILKAHGATIQIDSTVGKGTSFAIALEAVDVSLNAGQPPPATPGPGRLERKVLVVDDEARVRKSARRLLEKLGCHVDEAEHGREADDRVLAAPTACDVLLIDMTMPGLRVP